VSFGDSRKDNGLPSARLGYDERKECGYLYSGAKAAVAHLMRLAGVELGPFNIRVNAISPGAIATPIFWGGSARTNA